jgi:histidyl-tRNA synthetase
LDDKVDGSKEFVINAPKIKEFLTEDEKIYFENLKKIMDFTGIEYIENSTLVRGLDYYNGIVFEFMSNSKILKGQSTIIGGGRYNKLIEQTGGPDVIGIGFGLGIERIIISTLEENPDFLDEISFDAIILPLSESSHIHAMKILNDLRKNDLKAIINNQTYKLSTHFKFADKYKSNNIIIIGDEELKNNNVIIKNQIDKTENRIEFDKIVDFLKLESSN